MPTNPQIEWSEQALEDVGGIVAYLAENDLVAAQSLKNEIDEKVEALSENPKLYAKSLRAPGYRQITVRPNYLVFYRLLSEKVPKIIDVAAVVHARRQWP